MKIEREVLERYLRAACHPSWLEQAVSMFDDGMRVDDVLDSLPGPDIRFALGVFYGAEVARERAEHCDNAARRAAFRDIEADLFRHAGLTRAQWEANR